MRPDWMKGLYDFRVWREDDAGAPDAESIVGAWTRIFGIPYPEEKTYLDSYDAGDATYYLHEKGRVRRLSYPGSSELYRIEGMD